MNYYKMKVQARQEAIDWQLSLGERNYYMSELIEIIEHFIKLGKRYGLLREFKENGII